MTREEAKQLFRVDKDAYGKPRHIMKNIDKIFDELESERKDSTPFINKNLIISLEDWDYQCGDGCCDMYGTEITLNGKKCDNQYAGDDVKSALEFVLSELGYEVDIKYV